MKPVRKFLLKVVLWACIFIFSLILLELLFALFSPSPVVQRDLLGRNLNPYKNGQTPKYVTFYHDNQPYWDFLPSQKGKLCFYNDFSFDWQVNEFSLRESRKLDVTDDEVFRILFLGDSQTFGYVLPDKTFCRLTESIINTQTARKIITLNGGVPGYGQYEALWKLIRIYDKVKPDLIVPVVFVDNWLIQSGGNDLWANYERQQHIKMNTTPPIWWEQGPDKISIKRLLVNHVHLARPIALLRNRIIGKPSYTLDHIRDYIQSRERDERRIEAWEATINILKEISDVGKRRSNAKTVVLYLPSIESLMLKDNSSYMLLLQTQLPVIDMFAPLSSVGECHDFANLRYEHDAHYNQFVHQLIAKTTADFLLRNNYIESDF